MTKYDVYKRPNGLFYRVCLDGPLHAQAELLVRAFNVWIKSGHTAGSILTSPKSSLKARNVVFKGRLC